MTIEDTIAAKQQHQAPWPDSPWRRITHLAISNTGMTVKERARTIAQSMGGKLQVLRWASANAADQHEADDRPGENAAGFNEHCQYAPGAPGAVAYIRANKSKSGWQ